ncbi:MFS transporter [Microbacterium hominis]|uniref:MFS transporter n=1 Tax=Microbacterium hominis TaxID=162426 RepID=UPI000AD13465|nr:MFS transporter [Microbacterium hominis]
MGTTYGLVATTGVLFIYFAAAAAPSPLLPSLLEQWKFAPWLLTFAFAIYALAILVALLFVGRLSDFVGRRPVILAATVVELIAMLLFLYADDIGTFVAARTAQGLATGAATGALSAAIADFAGERRVRLTSTLGSVAPLAGLACGAVFVGAVAEYAPVPKSTVFVSFVILCALALPTVGVMRESSTRRPGARRSLLPRVAVPAAARTAFWRAVPIACAVWMAGGFYLSVVGEAAREIFGLHDEFTDSVLIAGLSGVGALSVALSQRLRAKTGSLTGALLIAVGMLCNIVAVQSSTTALLIVGTVVSGAGFGMAFAGAVGLVIPHARAHERAEVFSAIYVVNYLAFGVPAIAAGFLIAPLGLSTAVIIYAAVIVVVAAIGVLVQGPGSRPRHR